MNGWIVALFALLFLAVGGAYFIFFMMRLARKVTIDRRELEARAALPGFDCGLCGRSTCKEFAADIVSGNADPGRCLPGGEPAATALRGLVGNARAKLAVVRCGARRRESPDIFEYSGTPDCATARSLYGGPRACPDACLGFGTCLPYCEMDAISIVDGLAVIDADRCTGCGACVASCPVGAIALVDRDGELFVACNSSLEPERRAECCATACTGCRACERPDGAPSFVIEKGLAKRSSWNIADVREFVRCCPTHVIREFKPTAKSGAAS